MRKINKIIIHCSANGPTSKLRARDLEAYHVNEKGWDHIGYHYVIPRDGTVEHALDESIPGIHCSGQNAKSIGICLVGGIQDGKGGDANKDGEIKDFENGQRGAPEDNFTPAQREALTDLVHELVDMYTGATVHGHNEFSAKPCPCFNVKAWWARVQNV